MHIRDPIHGAIVITPAERRLIDSPYVQRLRNIKQLGFAEVAFPGATHARFVHALGAMAVASRIFDAVFRDVPLDPRERARLRQAVRTAVLLHDLGHPPLSHTSERALPPLSEVGLPAWLVGGGGRRASHEDMGLKLVVDSDLTPQLETSLAGEGITAVQVAALLSGREPPGGTPFEAGGVDWTPLLRQLVSSELDADRMDYLLRDSLYTGVNYGKFDLDWIIQNLSHVVRDGRAQMALDRRAVFAFEDFLLSRYHMFMSVYFHRTSIAYEEMLLRFYDACPHEYRLPAEPAAYVEADDVQLVSALRVSSSEWARRIVERRPYRAVYEEHPGDPDRADAVLAALSEQGLDAIVSESRGEVSKYLGTRRGIFVRTDRGEVPVEQYTPLFERHAEAAILVRVYVPPEEEEAAREAAARATR